MSLAALSLRGVSVRYEPGEPTALADIDFDVAPGERVALLGLNGSGKTTLLKAAVGLAPHEGAIAVEGTAVDRRSLPRIRDRVGFLFNVPEDQLLFPTAEEDVAFGLRRRGASAKEALEGARRALESLGVGRVAASPLHHLSHGQKQRVALAGALVGEPALLLLDEPSAGLDPPGSRALARLLADRPAAMLVATHDLGFARRLCARFLVLDAGRIAYDGADQAAIRRRFGSEIDEG